MCGHFACAVADPTDPIHTTALPCRIHYACQGKPEDHTGELAPCGKHPICSGNIEMHSIKGSACAEFQCHAYKDVWHTTCKWCGGALCNGAAHGENVCGGFKYVPPAPKRIIDEGEDIKPGVDEPGLDNAGK